MNKKADRMWMKAKKEESIIITCVYVFYISYFYKTEVLLFEDILHWVHYRWFAVLFNCVFYSILQMKSWITWFTLPALFILNKHLSVVSIVFLCFAHFRSLQFRIFDFPVYFSHQRIEFYCKLFFVLFYFIQSIALPRLYLEMFSAFFGGFYMFGFLLMAFVSDFDVGVKPNR